MDPQKTTQTKTQDQDSDWSISSVQIEQLKTMQVDEDDLCDPQSKVSNMYDDFSQMSKITSPEKPNIKPSTGIYKIGKLYTFVGEFMVVEATDSMVLDLDNYVFDKEKRILGFVADVLGPVNKPYYAIKLEDLAIRTTLEMGQPIYFCDGSKLIGKDKIQQLKKVGQSEAVEAKSDNDDEDQVKSDKGPVKRLQERHLEDEPRSRGRRYDPNYIRNQQVPSRSLPKQQIPHPAQFVNQMAMIPQPPAGLMYPPPMGVPPQMYPNEQQQMYMQGLYKQYYDEMMQLYSHKR